MTSPAATLPPTTSPAVDALERVRSGIADARKRVVAPGVLGGLDVALLIVEREIARENGSAPAEETRVP